jgi:hypothetical protein
MHPFPNNAIPSSVELMDVYLRSSARSGQSSREAYLARESLHGILRLARSEQLMEIRRSVDKLVPTSMRPQPVKRGKPKRSPRAQPGQKQFVFGREN